MKNNFSLSEIKKNSWWNFENLKVVSIFKWYKWRYQIEFYKDQDRNIDQLIIEDEEFNKENLLNLLEEMNKEFSNIIFCVFNSENCFWKVEYEMKKIVSKSWNNNRYEDFFITLIHSNVCSSENWETFEEYLLKDFNEKYSDIDFQKVKKFLLDSFKNEFWQDYLNNESSLISYYLSFVHWVASKDKIFTVKEFPEYFHSWKNRWTKCELYNKLSIELNNSIIKWFEVSEDWKYLVDWKTTEEILDLISAVNNLN